MIHFPGRHDAFFQEIIYSLVNTSNELDNLINLVKLISCIAKDNKVNPFINLTITITQFCIVACYKPIGKGLLSRFGANSFKPTATILF